jgi:hypothetical protein
MESESARPLARRAMSVLADPRTIRVGASAFYPAVMSALIGGSGTLVNASLTALAVWPVRHAHPPVYLLSLLLVFVIALPILYFVLGTRYGLARAAFSVYEVARPAVIDLVIEQVRAQNAAKRGEPVGGTPAPSEDERQERKIPRAIRWLIKAILTIAGAGDRLTDAVAEIDQQERPKTVIVGAILDDLVADNLVTPARNIIILAAIINAALLVAMFFMV